MWASSSIRAHLLFLLDPANQSMESQILFQSELPPATFICIWNPRYILLNTREPSIIPSLFQSYLHVRANLSLACPIRLNQANASNKSSDLQHEHHIPMVLMHASSRWSPYFKLHRIYQNPVSTQAPPISEYECFMLRNSVNPMSQPAWPLQGLEASAFFMLLFHSRCLSSSFSRI